MHLVAVGGRDLTIKRALESVGLNVRPAKGSSDSWRYESAFRDYGEALKIVDTIQTVTPVLVRPVAVLVWRSGASGHNSLPAIPAGSVREGMVMFTGDGDYDVVTSARLVEGTTAGLRLEHRRLTHNFIAERY